MNEDFIFLDMLELDLFKTNYYKKLNIRNFVNTSLYNYLNIAFDKAFFYDDLEFLLFQNLLTNEIY